MCSQIGTDFQNRIPPRTSSSSVSLSATCVAFYYAVSYPIGSHSRPRCVELIFSGVWQARCLLCLTFLHFPIHTRNPLIVYMPRTMFSMSHPFTKFISFCVSSLNILRQAPCFPWPFFSPFSNFIPLISPFPILRFEARCCHVHSSFINLTF